MYFDREQIRPLRDYQAEAKANLDRALSEGALRVMIQGPCGFGKTLTAAHIIADYVELGKRVCFIAPRLTLIDQTVDALEREGFGSHIGVIQGTHALTDYDKLVQVASLQTLTRRRLPYIHAFLVDEAHMTSTQFLELMDRYPLTPFIGLSATPWRPGLGRSYQELIVAETTQGLINRGYLVPFKVFAPAPEIDLSGVDVLGTGEYNLKQLNRTVNTREIVGDVIRHWQELGENRPTICFCVTRDHAQHIQERFIEAGIPAGYVDCFSSDDERRTLIEQFRAGEIRVICNVGVLTTGFDAPEASCMIDAAPTKSMILHVQKTGRVLRTAPGKKDAIILDHAGNTLSLGYVTDINRSDMCTGTPESRAKAREEADNTPKPKKCPECRSVVPKGSESCPSCGHVFHRMAGFVHKDGHLVAAGEAGVKERAIDSLEHRRRFLGELQLYGFRKDYKSGWAAVQYRRKYNVWPSEHGISYVPMQEPSLETLNWIRSGQIAWSKQQHKLFRERQAAQKNSA